MFGLDAFHLARIQFAFTVSFHIIFPAITIGLASFLALLEGFWLKTKESSYLTLYQFWYGSRIGTRYGVPIWDKH
ncbi:MULTISPECIES: cytochrome ubiquinol oxidase subunit I [Proteus]|uniref:cytochrome ubiquinol oxidase subunit I n=1 Tax=Proteus TaxID=583 RepID=UPI00142EA172|nr:cytochrome ubiquinol oxidase subunit I [Proteus columbae]MBG3019272.1 cytochrome ubiquinol oxidase subunit I [Proteus mirabilis]